MAKRFNDDFKQMIVDLAQTDMPLAEIADSYSVGVSTIQKWVKASQDNKLQSTTSADVTKLRQELAAAKQENDILKKSLAIFARKIK
ncbi:transposase [Periweissella cryptocerci]|uniref:Transposase n=1 Tax=Periweissella cryptocerci TaxID=2506420 RepID=A0A4P6YSP6_9LACO|nr:transposase [Periweissella cryptocerci]QBO35734.1 transposase [Periweissella cryptocerci]